ncbi:O-linked N-acetylglucosamine transferase, SPINDLY family protein [Aureimonas frigidaquae]|uniref:O-linked N-acetylglucosamine transferase, SPINDLY family protein n=1 Tax=Aureimonas frigidaquae TaxID=424757 RepID=UPI000784F442|nr:tetratricopeptide repeat protein [Aureimonas frigidaquae]
MQHTVQDSPQQGGDIRQAAAAHFNSANADFRDGRWEAALSGFEAALALDETMEPAAIQAARCHANRGQWQAARDGFARVLMINPASYTAWLESGHACRRLGLFEDADQAYRRAAGLAPERHETFVALARILEEFGRFQDADDAVDKAVAAAARTSAQTVATVHRMMARYRLEQKLPDRALASLEAGIRVAAESAATLEELCDWQVERGYALMLMGEHARAHKAFGAASVSTREGTLLRLAEVSYMNNLWEEAGEVLRRCVALHPTSVSSLMALARHCSHCWDVAEAERLLQQVEALGSHPEVPGIRANARIRGGDAEEGLRLLIDEAKANHDGGRACSRVAMTSLYSDSYSAAQILDLHTWLFEPLGVKARERASFRREPLAGRRIRLGFISADMHYQHPVNIFMQPILRELDRSRFECFVYAAGGLNDDQTQLARQRSEHWVEVETWTDAQLAARIEQDKIDILVDLLGHTAHSRGMMLGRRAAPVQVNYLGYPGTTGIPNMDWLISDAVVTPDGAERYYSERVARLPGTVFCFAPEEDYPLPPITQEMAERPLTFGSVNNIAKYSTRTLGLYKRVLDSVEGSRLSLRTASFSDPQATGFFRARLQDLGFDTERVSLQPPLALPQMMRAYRDIDIVLDAHPYNGGTTSLQALWMGVPVITLEGQQFVSRMGTSFLTAAGLADWIAPDDDAYVALAQEKARDRAALVTLRRELRQRLLARDAWNPVIHTRNFEKALIDILKAEGYATA